MIESINGITNYATVGAYPAATPKSSSGNVAARQDNTSLSPSAKTVSGLLGRLPTQSFDPAFHLKNANADLQQLMQKLGIPASTQINIRSNNDGTFVVESGNPKASEIERMLNDGSAKALRNDLIGMENSAKIQQIAQKVSAAMHQAETNPTMTDTIYGQLPGVANHIMSQVFALSYTNAHLGYTLSTG